MTYSKEINRIKAAVYHVLAENPNAEAMALYVGDFQTRAIRWIVAMAPAEARPELGTFMGCKIYRVERDDHLRVVVEG